MKQKLIVTTLAICVLTIGSLTANAGQRPGGGDGSRGMARPESGATGGHCQNRDSQHNMITELLDLTEEQKDKIGAIRQEGRTANENLREEKQEYQKQLRELVAAGSFDEAAIRVIAEKKAAVEVDLAVSRAKMRSETLAIMSPEQQELAKKLRAAHQKNRCKHQKDHGGRW